jgi:hypothetical protein
MIVITSDCKGVVNKSNYQSKPLDLIVRYFESYLK